MELKIYQPLDMKTEIHVDRRRQNVEVNGKEKDSQKDVY
jgi:hypothetical protein